MFGIIGIGVGAGVVSALLTLSVGARSALALPLFLLAPLPVAIAALGWNHRAGLIATAAGAALLGLAYSPRLAALYVVATGLPAWWFSYLALLARQRPHAVEWYPIGRILVWIAAAAAALALASLALIATDYETYVRSFGRGVDFLERINPRLFEQVPPELRAATRAAFARLAADWLAPMALAASGVFATAGLTAAAGRIVLASGRLPRPWPHLPALVLPKRLLPALAASLLACFLDGFAGIAARVLFAAFAAVYALQGFALMHAVTAGRPARGAMLGGLYALALLLWPTLLLAAAAGVADALFNLRARRGLAPPEA